MNVELLKELGLDAAANKLGKKLDLKRKLLIAYEHFRFVEPQIFFRFAKELKEKSYKVEQHDRYAKTETWREVVFVHLKDYSEIPPADCLMDLKKAKDMGCFDYFEVAKVEEVTRYSDTRPLPDPIIFGCIKGCVDKFFITQWDNDVSIEEILREKEG